MDSLNLNSEETLPNLSARVAFQVNSSAVFKEDVDIVPVIVDDTLLIVCSLEALILFNFNLGLLVQMVTRNLRISCESFAPNCAKIGSPTSQTGPTCQTPPQNKNDLHKCLQVTN